MLSTFFLYLYIIIMIILIILLLIIFKNKIFIIKLNFCSKSKIFIKDMLIYYKYNIE